jgi:hypothetical protein
MVELSLTHKKRLLLSSPLSDLKREEVWFLNLTSMPVTKVILRTSNTIAKCSSLNASINELTAGLSLSSHELLLLVRNRMWTRKNKRQTHVECVYIKIRLGGILIISYLVFLLTERSRWEKKASGQFIIKVYLDALLKAPTLSERHLNKDAALQLLPSF